MTTISVKQYLNDIRDLIKDEKHWIQQGCYARDRNGFECDPDSVDACKWCLQGALIRVMGIDYITSIGVDVHSAICDALVEHKVVMDLVLFNDHRNTSHQDVMNVLDRAIEIREERQEMPA